MSVVIVGGNERMAGQYKALCGMYRCKAKIYPKLSAGAKSIGAPDLLVLFTAEMSHKLLHTVLGSVKGGNTRIVRCRTGSMAALRNVLETHAGPL